MVIWELVTQYRRVMKKFFFFLVIATIFASCGDSDSDSYGNLSKISVADAALIYKRGGISRSGDGEATYWKMDKQGNEMRIVCYDDNGRESDVSISDIQKLNEELLLVQTTSRGDFLANVRTEKLYLAPNEMQSWSGSGPVQVQATADGMLYFLGHDGMVYQLDTKDYSYKSYLPEGQRAANFLVSQKGSCWYRPSTEMSRIVTKGGRVYPQTDFNQIFLSEKDGMLYSVKGFSIVRWREVSDMELAQEEVCQADMYIENAAIFINPRNKNVVLSYIGHGEEIENGEVVCYEIVAEFDGTRLIEKSRTRTNWGQDTKWFRFRNCFFDIYSGRSCFQWKTINPGQVFFSEEWAKYYTLDLDTYDLTENDYTIPAEEYEVYTTEPGFDSMMFSALCFRNGRVVIGKVDKNGQVQIISEQESSEKVTQLIPLN